MAQQAFDQASAVYTEIDLSPANQVKALPFYTREGDETLEDIIGREMITALDTELGHINPALNSKPFAKLEVWAVTFTLPQLESQIQGKVPLDVQLWQRAEKAGKKTGALETLKDQLGKFDQFTMEEQKELLSTTLKTMKLAREKGVDPYLEILNGYLTADQKGLEKVMTQEGYMGVKIKPETQKKFNALLLDKRNAGMAATIQKALEDPEVGSCFFAAGTLHYIGDKSVNSLLKKSGYTVSLVK